MVYLQHKKNSYQPHLIRHNMKLITDSKVLNTQSEQYKPHFLVDKHIFL